MIALHQKEIDFPHVGSDFLKQPSAVWERKFDDAHLSLSGNTRPQSLKAPEIGVRIVVDNGGDGFWDFIKISDDIFMTLNDVSYQQGEDIIVQGEDLVKIRFILKGNIDLDGHDVFYRGIAEDQEESYTMLSYHPKGIDSSYTLAPNTHHVMMTLHCKRKWIGQLFSRKFMKFFNIRDFAHIKQPLSATLPLHPRMSLCINEMLSSPYLGKTRLTFMYAKALELLCNVFHAIAELSETTDHASSSILLTKLDRTKLSQIQEILESQLSNWHTTQELGRKFGLNTKKLKYGFKSIYGMTPYKYSVDMRMQKAYKMLKEDSLSVSEVAYKLGYDYAANFTTAFKRQYGFPPRILRRQKS